MRLRTLLAVGALALGPACRAAERGTAVSGPPLAFRGEGRTHGRVARAYVSSPMPGAVVTLEAGTILRSRADPTLQRYLLVESVQVRPGPEGAPIHGLCLDADLRPWDRGAWVRGVGPLSVEAWSAESPPATTQHPRVGRRAALRAVLAASFGVARADPRYRSPAIPDADDVVRQWAIWRATDGKRAEDLAATVAREAPGATAEQRAAYVAAIWAATTVVLETGGRGGVGADDVVWGDLDLTRK